LVGANDLDVAADRVRWSNEFSKSRGVTRYLTCTSADGFGSHGDLAVGEHP